MTLPTHNVQAEFQGGFLARRKNTMRIAVHHAAALYRQAAGIEDVRAVAAYHTKTRGWPGIGYHICLAEETNGGRIARYNVSDLDLVRAHVAWWNDRAVGVSCLTNFTGIPEQKWIDALAEVLAELQQRYPSAIIVGHKEIALGPQDSPDGKDWRTACPGPRWADWKPQLLARVDRLLAPTPAPTPDWEALWGPIASPDQTSWNWDIPKLWKVHHARLGKCLAPALYGDGVVVQLFEGGDVRGRDADTMPIYEVCFK